MRKGTIGMEMIKQLFLTSNQIPGVADSHIRINFAAELNEVLSGTLHSIKFLDLKSYFKKYLSLLSLFQTFIEDLNAVVLIFNNGELPWQFGDNFIAVRISAWNNAGSKRETVADQ